MGVPYAEVIGDPIAHSKSPVIHNFWLKKLGIDAEYRACRVGQAELGDYLRERREDTSWLGCNLTMPLKEAVIPLLDTITRSAGQIGAVNTVRRDDEGKLHGRNTDVHGIWRCLDQVELQGKRALLIGAGGAGRAAAYALRRYEGLKVSVMNRSREKTDQILADFRLDGAALALGSIPDVDLVVNASALGMAHAPWPDLDLSALPPNATIFDMVYSPLQTDLLREAKALGMNVIDGLSMLVWQASEAFGVFFRQAHPGGAETELRELLL